MADVNGVDEGIAHQAADQAYHPVGGENAGGGIGISSHFRTLHIVDRFHQIINAEGNGGDQQDAEEFKSTEDVIEGRKGNVESKI